MPRAEHQNIVSTENNLLPCLSRAHTSSLLAAAQLQQCNETSTVSSVDRVFINDTSIQEKIHVDV